MAQFMKQKPRLKRPNITIKIKVNLMSDLTRRKIQAETDANLDIQAKDFQHTNAYRILAGDSSGMAGDTSTSGEMLRRQLMRRAEAKKMGLDLSYERSNLGSNLPGREEFLANQRNKRKQKIERRLRKRESVESQNNSIAAQNGPQNLNDTPSGQSPADITKIREQARERFGGSSSGTSTYNPYA